MAYEVAEAKVNPSRSYGIGTGMTKASHPLADAPAGRVRDNSRSPRISRTVSNTKISGRRGAGSRIRGGLPRTIIP